ncbi:Serine/threonine-protein kinase fray2 [Vitis vinifera]|uniref:Serine/threonine-protein kinase fray2 n=1 Tax=Vitis vinifera TaxID=29760 RepID=A0A438JN73_VITVI|nr:Serine/threonine-protein kinase fray2 [Vitis vinifera]
MEYLSNKKFPINSKDYKLYEEVGEGVSATVYRALCIPFNEIVAVKVMDLERCNDNLDGIRHEVQTMSLIDHPNVLRAHCSFSVGSCLWIVMPYMASGSCLHIMKSSYPEGFEQAVIATLLREVLKALVYLHSNGHIHRDVKAGNILVDSKGAIKLADFGVSACMFDAGDRQRSRNTFVGTPCWMAPEVMQQLNGYDFKADIWSFGITALELAHGHAPFSKYPPMKVLLMTLQNAPPGLDYERDRRFSKSFKEMVGACLVKDPKKRPTSEKLLKHRFFKHARSKSFWPGLFLMALLTRCSVIAFFVHAKEADFLVQKRGKLPIHKDLVNGRALDENDDFHEDEVFGAIMPINEDRKESSRYDELVDTTRRVKVEIPEFDSRLDPSMFLDWLANLEDYFD